MPQIQNLMREAIELTKEEERMIIIAYREIGKEIQDLVAVEKELQNIETDLQKFEHLATEVDYVLREHRPDLVGDFPKILNEFIMIHYRLKNVVCKELNDLYGKLKRDTSLQKHVLSLVKRIERLPRYINYITDQFNVDLKKTLRAGGIKV